MQKMLWAAVAAFVLTSIAGPFVIPWLKKLKFGQTIYDLGPESHKKKQGTPTMGGILFAGTGIVSVLIFARWDEGVTELLMILLSMIGFGAVGFVDDWIKVKLKRSLGLTPKQKLIPQILLSAVLAVWAYFTPSIGSRLTVPFFHVEWELNWVYIPVMMFILVGTVNSANLLDGLDGLLSGCSMIDFITTAIISVGLGIGCAGNTGIVSAVMVGALLAFLRFNAHPAKVFMGDTGSFFIGGALVGIMMVTRLSLFLPVIALAMFASSLSDIIQISYFKWTRKRTGEGKRIFKMAPLHHHFELSGMPETEVVTMYEVFTAFLCVLALLHFV